MQAADEDRVRLIQEEQIRKGEFESIFHDLNGVILEH
jgi:hypothetical protein